MNHQYYVKNKKKLIRDFKKKLNRVNSFLASYFPDTDIEELKEEFLKSFEKRIPGIPYIGGHSNPLTMEIVQSAWVLAIYDVLCSRGKSLDEIGMFVYQVREALIKSYPKWFLRLIGRYWFSKHFKNKRRKLARETQRREYEENFVINFIEGEEGEFDFGFDDIECGILKYFTKERLPDLVPYLCASDISMSKALNLGIQRTTTLAMGGKCCDFRLKQNGETTCAATAHIHKCHSAPLTRKHS